MHTYLFPCVFVRIYMYLCMYVTSLCIYVVFKDVFLDIRVYACIHLCMNACMSVWMYVFMDVCIWTRVYAICLTRTSLYTCAYKTYYVLKVIVPSYLSFKTSCWPFIVFYFISLTVGQSERNWHAMKFMKLELRKAAALAKEGKKKKLDISFNVPWKAPLPFISFVLFIYLWNHFPKNISIYLFL